MTVQPDVIRSLSNATANHSRVSDGGGKDEMSRHGASNLMGGGGLRGDPLRLLLWVFIHHEHPVNRERAERIGQVVMQASG